MCESSLQRLSISTNKREPNKKFPMLVRERMSYNAEIVELQQIKHEGLTLQASNNCAFENFHFLLHGHSSNATHQHSQPEKNIVFFNIHG